MRMGTKHIIRNTSFSSTPVKYNASSGLFSRLLYAFIGHLLNFRFKYDRYILHRKFKCIRSSAAAGVLPQKAGSTRRTLRIAQLDAERINCLI